MLALQCGLIAMLTVFSASGTAPWGGWLAKYIMQRPFIGGLLCGIILGDISTGVAVGAAMQLVYIGYFNVGGVSSIDLGIISFPCVALAILTDIDTAAAITLATALGTLFNALEIFSRTAFLTGCGSLMRKGCEEGNDKKIFWGYLGIPTIIYFITRGLTSFVLLYYGAGVVENLYSMLPARMVTAFNSVGAFLPCIGMATLLVFLANDVWGLVIFALGFACYGYLGLNSTSILLFALVFAYLYYRTGDKQKHIAKAEEFDEDEEVI
ncbi:MULTISPECIES: PTS sugar transporter subunit IIC [unclassified Clostridium]|jgi:PTS system mannose-specific IIC component|uniref:PTS sugar transporter subunit IIC n=1 Tax=unclassified Clostridium TaxID=2614128 RepID=UPI0011072D71|nr:MULTISPECIES: PTS sugar transporter subunit IIC [unclassified Clostridium]